MGHRAMGRDMRQDRRSQEETVQEDMEHQNGTGDPGIGHKVTDGTMRMRWDELGWDMRCQEGT